MFGKPISKATKVDLDRLIRDKEPEGRHLEFKSDFPGDPSGAAWTPGKPVPAKRIQPPYLRNWLHSQTPTGVSLF